MIPGWTSKDISNGATGFAFASAALVGVVVAGLLVFGFPAVAGEAITAPESAGLAGGGLNFGREESPDAFVASVPEAGFSAGGVL
jgi:hypothetical protein